MVEYPAPAGKHCEVCRAFDSHQHVDPVIVHGSGIHVVLPLRVVNQCPLGTAGTGKAQPMGEATGRVGMMEFLNMGGYAGYVWSFYVIVVVVLVLNLLVSWQRYKSVLHRLEQLYKVTSDHES